MVAMRRQARLLADDRRGGEEIEGEFVGDDRKLVVGAGADGARQTIMLQRRLTMIKE